MNLNLHLRCGINRHALHKFLLIMKLVIMLLTTAILQVSAHTYAQKITLNRSNTPLEKVMKEIRTQSGYDFFYDLEFIKNTKPVTINLKNATIEQALEQSFAGQPLTYSIAEGLAFGFISYTAIKLFTGRHREIHWMMYVITIAFFINFYMSSH